MEGDGREVTWGTHGTPSPAWKCCPKAVKGLRSPPPPCHSRIVQLAAQTPGSWAGPEDVIVGRAAGRVSASPWAVPEPRVPQDTQRRPGHPALTAAHVMETKPGVGEPRPLSWAGGLPGLPCTVGKHACLSCLPFENVLHPDGLEGQFGRGQPPLVKCADPRRTVPQW